MSNSIIVPAAKITQGSLILYATSMKVCDLLKDGFYSVETLDPENSDKGYQRLLNKARAKKLANYVLNGQENQDAFLPTSIFLATDKSIPYNETDHTLEINIPDSAPFSVVDGQHRLEGLKMAADKNPNVRDFQVPVNIAVDLPKIHQMCHFLIVNTTQKSVDKSIEQRIITRLTDAMGMEDTPSLPKWIDNAVQRGEVERATRYVDYLNEEDGSPWLGKIKMANSIAKDASVNQKTFVKAIVKYILTANNPLNYSIGDIEKEKKIFLNYWKAIANLLDDGNSAVLYKFNGVELFCRFSNPFFTMLLNKEKNFKVETMEKILENCFENVEGDYAGVGHPNWWARGSGASRLNAAAINIAFKALCEALNRGNRSKTIEV